jgi:hypothetical protein
MWSTDLNLEIPFAIKNTLATAYLTMKRYSLVKSVVGDVCNVKRQHSFGSAALIFFKCSLT